MAAARRNAFLRGFGGMFEFVNVLNRRLLAESAAEADAEALRQDWERVGGYLYDAMGLQTRVYKTYLDAPREETCQANVNDEK